MKMLFAWALVILMSLTATPAYAQLSEVSVFPGQSEQIDRHGICKVVKNLHSTDALYVPSMTLDEWVNFLSVPPWREVSDCDACEGYARDGYCFYAAKEWLVAGDDPFQTCDEVCSGHGGVDPAGMNKLVGLSTTASMSYPQIDAFNGVEFKLAGGGAGVGAGGGNGTYCRTITNALIAHSIGQGTLMIGQATAGCQYTLARKMGPHWGEIVIGTGWRNMQPPQVGGCSSARPICACNR